MPQLILTPTPAGWRYTLDRRELHNGDEIELVYPDGHVRRGMFGWVGGPDNSVLIFGGASGGRIPDGVDGSLARAGARRQDRSTASRAAIPGDDQVRAPRPAPPGEARVAVAGKPLPCCWEPRRWASMIPLRHICASRTL